MKTAIIIPARYASKRLPGKPLLKVKDKTIIQWVWEKAVSSNAADDVIIATDNDEIYGCAKGFGAHAEMTRADHSNGSERIAEVAEKYPEFDYIINLQGDEPMIKPEYIRATVEKIQNTKEADISTLITQMRNEDVDDPNCVKCVTDINGFAMYFSRSKIPYERNTGIASFYKHIGIYGYKRESLFNMIKLESPEIERAESLEQLRALYNGMKIITSVIEDYDSIGIDTIEDYNMFKKRIEERI